MDLNQILNPYLGPRSDLDRVLHRLDVAEHLSRSNVSAVGARPCVSRPSKPLVGDQHILDPRGRDALRTQQVLRHRRQGR